MAVEKPEGTIYILLKDIPVLKLKAGERVVKVAVVNQTWHEMFCYRLYDKFTYCPRFRCDSVENNPEYFSEDTKMLTIAEKYEGAVYALDDIQARVRKFNREFRNESGMRQGEDDGS